MIVGILLAILVIALVLWLLVFNNNSGGGTPVDGDTDGEETELPDASAAGWRLVDVA
jgi:hypothetical protein